MTHTSNLREYLHQQQRYSSKVIEYLDDQDLLQRYKYIWRHQWTGKLVQTISRHCSSVLELCRRHRHYSFLWCKKSSWTQLQTTWDQTGIRGKLAGLFFMERTHISVVFMELMLLHPLVASGSLGLSINGNPLPQTSGRRCR